MKRLTIVYDVWCGRCARGRAWLEAQRTFVALEFVAWASEEAKARYGAPRWLGAALAAVGDGGEVWLGRDAFVVALWALEGERERSYRAAADVGAPSGRCYRLGLGRQAWPAAWFAHEPCARFDRRGSTDGVTGPYR